MFSASGISNEERRLTGALNKLADRNFDAILRTVLDCLGCMESAAVVVKEILKQSSVHSCYAHLFARLLQRVLMHIETVGDAIEEVDNVKRQLHVFVENFVGLPFLDEYADDRATCVQGCTEDYDAFCLRVKAKAMLVGHARTVQHLLAMRLVSLEQDALIQSIIAALASFHSLSDAQVNLLLDLLIEAGRVGGVVTTAAPLSMQRDSFLEMLKSECARRCPKLRFKLMDVLRMADM